MRTHPRRVHNLLMPAQQECCGTFRAYLETEMNLFRAALLLIALSAAVGLAGCRNDNNDNNPPSAAAETA
jgi:hypothetical protein